MRRRRGNATLLTVRADEQTGINQLEILRRLTPDQRWQAARALYWTSRRHKEAFLRSLHPDWSEERSRQAVREIFLYART